METGATPVLVRQRSRWDGAVEVGFCAMKNRAVLNLNCVAAPPRTAVCPKPQHSARQIRVKIIPAAIRSSVRCELGQLAPRSTGTLI